MSTKIKFFTRTLSVDKIDHFTADQICLGDIAHSLSMICRFNGHVPKHYSVAEHSVLVLQALEFAGAHKITENLQRATLLHDANECYVGDIIRPVLNWLKEQNPRTGGMNPGFTLPWLCSHFTNLIHQKFGVTYLTPEDWAIIHAADDLILNVEGYAFFGSDWETPLIDGYRYLVDWIQYLSSEDAKNLFIKEFYNVYRRDVEKK